MTLEELVKAVEAERLASMKNREEVSELNNNEAFVAYYDGRVSVLEWVKQELREVSR